MGLLDTRPHGQLQSYHFKIKQIKSPSSILIIWLKAPVLPWNWFYFYWGFPVSLPIKLKWNLLTQQRYVRSSKCKLCGSPFSDLTSWGWQGNLWGSATGNLTMAEKQEGLSTTSTQILADRVYTYGAQLVMPTNIFAHLQNKVRPTRTREFGRVWKPDLDLQRRSFLAPEPSLPMPR